MLGLYDMKLKTPTAKNTYSGFAYIVFSVSDKNDLKRLNEIWELYLNYSFCGFSGVHIPKYDDNARKIKFTADEKYIIKYSYKDGTVTIEKYDK